MVVWIMIGELLTGQLALIQIKERLSSFDGSSGFIAKYLEPVGESSVTRLPCHDCDENCDNQKWIKKLSCGDIVKVCPLHPMRFETVMLADVSYYRLGKNFYRVIAEAMRLQNIPKIFQGSGLIHLGNWNTSSFFGAVYVALTAVPRYLEDFISRLFVKSHKDGKTEQFVIITPTVDGLSDDIQKKMRGDRSKCICFDNLFSISNAGELIFKSDAPDYFSTMDMTRQVNRQTPFIQYKEIAGKIHWYVQGRTTAFKRTPKSVHYKILNLLVIQYNAGGLCWVGHKNIMLELNWSSEKYWGNTSENSGQAQKVVSDLRREVGIEIEYDKRNGFRITGAVKS